MFLFILKSINKRLIAVIGRGKSLHAELKKL